MIIISEQRADRLKTSIARKLNDAKFIDLYDVELKEKLTNIHDKISTFLKFSIYNKMILSLDDVETLLLVGIR